ncbi:YbaK/EbsC family protein, partial [Streptomyces sp. SID8380]|nr:YbaK/EbsC family protein [Streptomyces sp. SID8380]
MDTTEPTTPLPARCAPVVAALAAHGVAG